MVFEKRIGIDWPRAVVVELKEAPQIPTHGAKIKWKDNPPHLDKLGARTWMVSARVVESLATARLRTMGVALASGHRTMVEKI